MQLQVFTDGSNDGFTDTVALAHVGTFEFAQNVIWRTSVHYDAAHTPGTWWHWPEKA